VIPRHKHARHRTPLSLRRRVIVPVLTVLAALALAAGIVPGLVSASAAPAAAVTVMADRAAAFPAATAEAARDKTLITLAAIRARARAAAAVLAARTYTVRAGDSMSSVAARHCGQARDWTGIYAASRARHWTAANANVLTARQHLYLSCAYLPSMLKFAPAPPPPPVIRTVTAVTASRPAYHRSYHRSYSAPAAVYHGGSGYQACVIARESGGNSQVMNSSGHYGLYQFDYGTWRSGGGSASTFGHASVAEQNQVFAAVYAARGTQPWSPSDGC
jgi:Transglycosylase-like domain